MKPTNLEGVGSHAEAIIRGWVDSGITFEAGGTIADSVRDLTIIGGTLIDNGDGTWTLIIGGGSGDGTDSISSAPVNMLNAAGRDLLPGDVVVVDETNDKAVTVTTSAGDTRIAGVVQEPIADGAIGKVLFNGFAAIINAPGAVRGEYAQTSTTETVADSTSGREAGSFAVYLTGTDVPDFATASVTTTAPVPVSSLAISVPAVIPTGRYLFLALWLTDDGTAPVVPGWTQIGSTSGFYYFARSSTGGDTATATWTGASTAVATVLLLHPSVVLAAPLEDFDYDATTSAASLSGLSDVAHYAIAGVDADVATPGSGFTRLGGGSADFTASGTPTLVQQSSYATSTGAITATLPAAATVGNLVVGLASAHDATSIYLTDPRDGGTCPIDSHASFSIAANTTPGANTALHLQGYNTADGYAGPFGSRLNCSTPAYHAIAAYEFSGVATSGSETLSSSGSHNETAVDVGDFTVGPNDLVLMAVTWQHPQSDPGIATDPNGFTTLYDGFGQLGAVGWTWLGYKVGDGDCSFSAPAGTNYWTAVAVHLTGGTNQAAGTLAGKYIGHDAAVTSPFSGGGQQDDALFAINLLADAKPSALLYGPDLGGSGSFSGNVEDIPTAETDTSLVLHPDGTGGIEWGIDATGSGSSIYRNVMDYGAVGDGTTDDTVALQAAIDACIDFETLFFPTGVYKITATLTIPVGLRLLGAGADNINYDAATTIHMTTANTTAISATVFEADITIENITILGAGGASSGRGLYSSSNTRLRSVRIADFYDAVYIDDSLGVPPSSAFYNHIERSWFVRNTHAGLVLHTKTNNTSISESYFAAQAYGVLADGGAFGLRIVNSSFEIHTSVAISIDGTGASQSTKGVYIAGCYFEQITGSPTADVSIGPTTRVYGVLIEGCFFIESAVTTLRHIDVNFATGVTIIGNYIGNNAEAGAIRGNSSNTLDMAVINNYVPGTVSTPATTNIIDPATSVTPASVGSANAVGASKYFADAAHVHALGGTVGGDLSGSMPNPSVVDDSHNHTAATVTGVSGLLTVDPGTPSYDTSGADVVVTVTAKWGFDVDGPYYNSAGVTSGDEAILALDPDVGDFAVVPYSP